MSVAIGTAGWAIPAAERDGFGPGGSTLARYATRLDCVEINSSFYRRHRPDTWRRWADAVPDGFRFSVKLPKTITHLSGLETCEPLIDEFADDVSGLGAKLAVVLVQLAPKHAVDAAVTRRFFAALRARVDAAVVVEPRHPSWFAEDIDALLTDSGVSRVAADPAVVPAAAVPGGSPALRYWRLHGSPAIYRSPYDAQAIEHYSAAICAAEPGARSWCIFDNTASSAAMRNALDLSTAVSAAGAQAAAG